MKKIVLASNNKHKVKEVKEILKEYEILTLNNIGFNEDITEDGNTFLENALIKAKKVNKYLKSKNLKYDVIADDSGLCVNTLNGEPGIYSARYSGTHDNSFENRKKLIKNLENKEDKSAYFNCTLVLYHDNDNYTYYEGKTYGRIIDEERWDTSFGYDAIFFSDDLGKTFGEATDDEKNKVSHRGRALEKLKNDLD